MHNLGIEKDISKIRLLFEKEAKFRVKLSRWQLDIVIEAWSTSIICIILHMVGLSECQQKFAVEDNPWIPFSLYGLRSPAWAVVNIFTKDNQFVEG